MRRAAHLRNDANPGVVSKGAPNFDVREGAVRVRASGLTGTDAIPIEVRVSGRDLNDGVTWAPLVRNGCVVALTATNTDYIELLKGTYRLGAGPAVGNISVVYEEDEGQLDDKLQYHYLVNPPCPVPPEPPAPPTANDVFPVTRCDSVTGAQVTILVQSLAGVATTVGHIGPDGAVVAGAYPGTLVSCQAAPEFDHSFFCDPVTGDKVLVVTTYTVAGAPSVAGYAFPSMAPISGPLTTLVACPDADTESDAIEMCSLVGGTNTILRWIVKVNGRPTGVSYDTTLAGAVIPIDPAATVGACAAAPVVQTRVEQISEPGCAAGVPFTRVTTSTYNADTGALISDTPTYVDSAGFTVTAPAGFTLGACPDVVQTRVEQISEPGCAAGVPFTRVTTSTYNADTGALISATPTYINSAGATVATPAGFTLGACVAPPVVQTRVEQISELGCAAGVPFTRVTTSTYNADTGVLISATPTYVNSAGATVAAPAGFTLGACPTALYDREVTTLCNAARQPVLVVYDVTVSPPVEVSRWNMATSAAEPAGPLSQCDSDQREIIPLIACLAGVEFVGYGVVSDDTGAATSEVWRDPATGTWGPLPAGAVVGKCPVIPPALIVNGGALPVIAGPARAATTPFAGAPDVVNTSAIGGALHSLTVSAFGVTDGFDVGSTANQVYVACPDGTVMVLMRGQTFTWSVVRDQDDSLRRDYKIVATGMAYANIGYTFT